MQKDEKGHHRCRETSTKWLFGQLKFSGGNSRLNGLEHLVIIFTSGLAFKVIKQ